MPPLARPSNAQADATAKPGWDASQAFEVADEGGEKMLPKGIPLVGRDNHLHKVTSVTQAAEELNAGKLKEPGGMCVVFSAASKKYFMVYRSDKEKEAHAVCNKEIHSKTLEETLQGLALAKAKTKELVIAKLPENFRASLDAAADKVGAPTEFLVWAALGAPLMLLLLPKLLMVEIVGAAYPACMTLNMVHLKMLGKQVDDESFWVTYWMLFSFLKSGPADFLLSYIPMWSYLKLALFIALYSPVTRGASVILEKGLLPFAAPKQIESNDTAKDK